MVVVAATSYATARSSHPMSTATAQRVFQGTARIGRRAIRAWRLLEMMPQSYIRPAPVSQVAWMGGWIRRPLN
eukprot:6612584-Pyramimonas_sp.AAC.1